MDLTDILLFGDAVNGGGGAEPVLQDKTVTLSEEVQTVTADDGYDGLGTVTVEAALTTDPVAAFIGTAKKNSTNLNSTFEGQNNLESVPWFDTSSVTAMSCMFRGCQSLREVPFFDTGKVTAFNSMFAKCISLKSVPQFDTSSATNLGYMFADCYELESIPFFNTALVTSMEAMCTGCVSITTIPTFDTRRVTNMASMLAFCHALRIIPALDCRSATSISRVANNSAAVTECWLRNIKANLQVGSGTAWGHLLTVDSLIHLIYELRDVGAARQLTMGSANLEKLANVYVRTVDITDAMRAEDDLIDEKLPFEVCESTDANAMLIIDYANEKNWTIV